MPAASCHRNTNLEPVVLALCHGLPSSILLALELKSPSPLLLGFPKLFLALLACVDGVSNVECMHAGLTSPFALTS